MQSEIDKSRQSYYLTCPELIKESGEWEKFYRCAACDGPLDPERHNCITHISNKNSWITVSSISCPHCMTVPPHTLWHGLVGNRAQHNGYVSKSVPIPFKLYWRRKHITFRPTWWQAKVQGRTIEFFYEYTEVKEHVVEELIYEKGIPRKRKKNEEQESNDSQG